MSKADDYRKRADAVAKGLSQRRAKEKLPLRNKKKALEDLADNEDWLDGKSQPKVSPQSK
jgi:hypothetical protein